MVTGMTYLGVAGMGMALVLIGILLGFANADTDAADLDVDTGNPDAAGPHVGAGLSLLSMTGIGAVLVGFGLFGYVMREGLRWVNCSL